MRDIPIFIASSMWEFEREREQISVFLDILNDIHKRDGVELVWKRPETMSEAYYFGGTQRQYDQEILKSRFFILIVGKKLGEHTEKEFRLALEQFKKTGVPTLLFYFLDVFPDMEVQTFRDQLRKLDAQYVNTYQNFDQILNKLHIELIRHGAFVNDVEPSSDEETAQKGQEAARSQRNEMVTLQKLKTTAKNLQNLNTQFRREAEKIVGYVSQLNGMWEGEAKEAFYEVFNNNKSKMDAFSRTIENYAQALIESASQYENAEKIAFSLASQRSV